jgi:hypothetical protein
VHRRDFLLLRQPSSPRVIDINCERLHMSYLDLHAAAEPAPATDGLSFEEPPATRPHREVDDWMRDLESQLQDADVIRVVGAEWLRPDALRQLVEAMLQRLVQRGARIERAG